MTSSSTHTLTPPPQGGKYRPTARPLINSKHPDRLTVRTRDRRPGMTQWDNAMWDRGAVGKEICGVASRS